MRLRGGWALLLMLLGLLGVPGGAAAQSGGSTQIWSGKKGSSANPGALTADDVDANTRALNVILKGTNTVRITGNTGATVDSTVAAGSAPTNQVVVGSVFNSSAPAPTNGQAMALQADQSGNLRVIEGMGVATLSVWNSGTSVNTTQNIFTNFGGDAALVHLVQSGGTFSAGAITFEVSYDGTNWVTIPADAVLDPASTTFAQISLPYTLVTATNKPFLLMGKGWQGLRIKLSTAITGTGTVTPNYDLLAYGPAHSVIALSPTANNFLANINASGTALTATGSSLNVNITGGAGSGGTAIQDNTAFTQGTTQETPAGCLFNTSYAAATSGRSTVLRCTSTGGAYVNIDQVGGSAITLGSKTSANSFPVVIASDQGAVPVSQSGTWTVQPGNTANTTPWLVIPGGGSASVSGQTAVTASATALASNSVKGCVTVRALMGNQIAVYIGPTGITTSTGYELQPGDASPCLYVSNTNQIFTIASTTGASVAFLASN